MLDIRIAKFLIFAGPIVSLVISPFSNYDPINLIKLVFVCSISFYCFALFFCDLKKFISRISNSIWILFIFFAISLLSPLIFSGAPINQQFWGTFGRNTGFLTYLSLLMILISAATIEKKDFYKSIVNSLVLTSIPMTFYCLLQIAKLDPIGWSEKHPFGTLGNINFSSAFFGLSTICALALVTNNVYPKFLRLLILLLVVIDLMIVASTGSIQGLMMFFAGAGIQGFMYINKKFKSKVFNGFYILIGVFTTFLTIFGLSNKGPLSKFLFAPSIVFRTDYWHAGYAMTLKFPLFGVGLDSYGDWYRTLRGEISTLRTGPDRIANTAHNIFLDLSSNGGLPLIISYVLILVVTFRCAINFLKDNSNPHAIALFTAWIGFIIFSSISIGQIGVGIWGWLFTGTILGLQKKSSISSIDPQNRNTKKRSKKIQKSKLSPGMSLIGFFGFVIGIILSLIPFEADVNFKNAMNTRAMDKIISSLNMPGITSFHYEVALTLAFNNHLTEQSHEIAQTLVRRYPLNFTGWQAIYISDLSTVEEKRLAIENLRNLDPYNPNLK